MFSWSRPSPTPGRSDSISSPSQSAATGIKNRQQHIDSYVNDSLLKPSTRCVKKEEIFETVFQTKNQTVLILRVYLPSSTTNESLLLQPPAMSLIGVRATHPWIDSSMKVVGFQPISSIESWNACGLPLGKVVKDVVQHFQLNPPTILEILDSSVQKIQPSATSVKSSGDSINQNSAVRKLPSTTLPPTYEQFVRSSGGIQSDSKKMEEIISLYMPSTTVPDYYPELNSLSKQELERLDTDTNSLLEFIQLLPLVQTTLCQKSSIEEENKKDAQRNLDQQEELSQLWKDISTLQQSLLDKIHMHETLNQKIVEMTQPKDTNDVLQQLHKGKRASFMESETIAKNLSEFPNHVEEFIDIRTLHHVRAAKMERLQQEIRVSTKRL